MTSADLFALLLLVVIAIAVGIYLLHWLFQHSTKENSLVRTGLGGEKVVMGGGAFVLPIIHSTTRVNMNLIPIEIRRASESSLFTSDKLRVDVAVKFGVRVLATKEGVSNAARTMGEATDDPAAISEKFQGRFVDAMSAVAAKHTMEDLHTNRLEYVQEVRAIVEGALEQNGYELESVSLVSLEQADITVFDDNNAFDSEGLTKLKREIEERRKARHIIENETRIAIKQSDYESAKRMIELDRDTEIARLEQARDLERRKAQQLAEIEEEKSASDILVSKARARLEEEAEKVRLQKDRVLEAERIAMEKEVRIFDLQSRREAELQAIETDREITSQRIREEELVSVERIESEQKTKERQIVSRKQIEMAEAQSRREVEHATISADREIEEMRVTARKYIERFEIEQQLEIDVADKNRLIAVINKSIEEAAAKTEVAKAEKVLAETTENIATARELEIAERSKKIELLEASSRAEREAIRLTSQAEAEKTATELRAEADVAEARAAEARYAVDAEGARALNEAENTRSEEARKSAIYEHLVKNLPDVIRETVKPMENIDSIKILQVDGVPGINSPSETGAVGGDGPGSGNMTDKVVNSAMKYRTQVAFVDGLMKDLGLPVESLGTAGSMSFKNVIDDKD